MAPLRRYLRITKYSVLEVRIYLDRPADADAWLLKRGNPALPRVIQAIRPLVLPKLREENERGKGRGAKSKKKGVKDIVVEDDFEVSIFLTELSSRHSVLTKHKMFKDKPRIQSNSGKLTGWLEGATNEQPAVINEDSADPIIIEEEEVVDLANIPEANLEQDAPRRSARAKRGRQDFEDEESDASDEDLFVSEPAKRSRLDQVGADQDETQDDKKLSLDTSYDGFSIYGRILCLVVKRRGVRSNAGSDAPVSSQQMLENWVSTQAAGQIEDDEGNG